MVFSLLLDVPTLRERYVVLLSEVLVGTRALFFQKHDMAKRLYALPNEWIFESETKTWHQ